MQWYLTVLKKYAVFEGRARRMEYWMFGLVNLLIAIALGIVEGVLGIAPDSEESIFAGIYMLAVLLPSIGVSIRRLHDTNRSGWWVLINAIPILGPLVFLVFVLQKGTEGPNDYGVDPLVEAVTPPAG